MALNNASLVTHLAETLEDCKESLSVRVRHRERPRSDPCLPARLPNTGPSQNSLEVHCPTYFERSCSEKRNALLLSRSPQSRSGSSHPWKLRHRLPLKLTAVNRNPRRPRMIAQMTTRQPDASHFWIGCLPLSRLRRSSGRQLATAVGSILRFVPTPNQFSGGSNVTCR